MSGDSFHAPPLKPTDIDTYKKRKPVLFRTEPVEKQGSPGWNPVGRLLALSLIEIVDDAVTDSFSVAFCSFR